MQIIDCFIVNHELDLLKLRFNILNNVVDKFVVTEGNMTFSGKPKENHFIKNIKHFKEWENKIVYNPIQIPLDINDPWEREIFSRNSHVKMLKQFCSDEDLILLSDADEIPNPKILKIAEQWYQKDKLFTFKMKMYYYFINNLAKDIWFGTRACSYSILKNTTVDNLRETTEDITKITGDIINDGGWHFSYCGDTKYIKQKIESFCDLNFNNDFIKNNIANNIAHNQDIFFRNLQYQTVLLDDTFPQYILDNQEQYKHLIKKY
jgi:beta-1,4-mannosyl-glycoprotein beta-1,4-N-acetylglucosaminyltransferase